MSGLILVLSSLVPATAAAIASMNRGGVAVAIVWSFILPMLGLTQSQLFSGRAHWVIEVRHLLVGLATIGLGNRLARQIGKMRQPVAQVSWPGSAISNEATMTVWKSRSFFVLVLALAAVLAACSDDPGPPQPDRETLHEGSVVSAQAAEFSFTLHGVELTAGRATFVAENGGSAERDFVIRGNGLEEARPP